MPEYILSLDGKDMSHVKSVDDALIMLGRVLRRLGMELSWRHAPPDLTPEDIERSQSELDHKVANKLPLTQLFLSQLPHEVNIPNGDYIPDPDFNNFQYIHKDT